MLKQKTKRNLITLSYRGEWLLYVAKFCVFLCFRCKFKTHSTSATFFDETSWTDNQTISLFLDSNQSSVSPNQPLISGREITKYYPAGKWKHTFLMKIFWTHFDKIHNIFSDFNKFWLNIYFQYCVFKRISCLDFILKRSKRFNEIVFKMVAHEFIEDKNGPREVCSE